MRYFFYSYTLARRTGATAIGRRFVTNEKFPNIPELEKLTITVDNAEAVSALQMIENVSITNIFEFKNEEDFINASGTQ